MAMGHLLVQHLHVTGCRDFRLHSGLGLLKSDHGAVATAFGAETR